MNEIIRNTQASVTNGSLDPQDWSEFRALAHRMLDEAIDGIANVRARPVWQPIPDEVRAAVRTDVPREATDLAEVYREFSEHVAPYATGNVHPGFMGWVHGGGTAVGMVAEMLAAGLNANLGGRDHMPIEVERQIVEWMRGLFGFPQGASGIFVTGTSMANLMAVLVARTNALGTLARQHGIGNDGTLLTAYASKAAHGCISRAMDIAGFGTDALRKIDVDADHRIDVAALRAQIAIDRGRLQAVSSHGIGRHRRYRCDRRSQGSRGSVPRGGNLVSRRWRFRCARDLLARACAAARGD